MVKKKATVTKRKRTVARGKTAQDKAQSQGTAKATNGDLTPSSSNPVMRVEHTLSHNDIQHGNRQLYCFINLNLNNEVRVENNVLSREATPTDSRPKVNVPKLLLSVVLRLIRGKIKRCVDSVYSKLKIYIRHWGTAVLPLEIVK